MYLNFDKILPNSPTLFILTGYVQYTTNTCIALGKFVFVHFIGIELEHIVPINNELNK